MYANVKSGKRVIKREKDYLVIYIVPILLKKIRHALLRPLRVYLHFKNLLQFFISKID